MADPALGASRIPQRLEQVLKQIAQADTPMLVSSSGPDGRGKPMRVQHLLDDSSASQLYERFGSSVQDQSYASDASPRSTSSGEAAAAVPVKQSRYLREQDRCDIIRRMGAGEKQADLAREFKVTRAAICHIKKNRVEILARSIHRDARHPKRARYQTISKPLITQLDHRDGQSQLPVVYEVRSLPMTALLTGLRNKETRSAQFRQFADRAIRLLLEEALACAETKAIDLITPSGCICEGIETLHISCGIALGEHALPMLESFTALHPDSPAGYVSFSSENQAVGSNQLVAATESDVQLPPNLGRHSVFLLAPTCPSSREVCAAVQTLLAHGAQEASIFFVCIVVSAVATSGICKRFPAIRIVTAAIDPHVNQIAHICPGIGDFSSRYAFSHTSPSEL